MVLPKNSETPGWPIARLLPALMVGLVFVSIAPVIVVAWLAAQSNLDASSLQRAEVTIDLIERRLEAHLRPVQNQLTYLSEAIARGEVDFDDREQWRIFALGTLAAVPQTVGFVVLPVEGEPTRFVRADRTMRPERRENVRGAEALLDRARTMDGPGWGEPVWSFVVGEPILPIIVPVRVRGEFRGVIGAAIGTTDLSRFLKEIELTGERTPFILAGRNEVLAHPKLAKTLNGDARAQTRLVTLEPDPSGHIGGSRRSRARFRLGARSQSAVMGPARCPRRRPLELGWRALLRLDTAQRRGLRAGRVDRGLSRSRPRIGVGALDRAQHPDRRRRADDPYRAGGDLSRQAPGRAHPGARRRGERRRTSRPRQRAHPA
ncbi:cache domain-containing protein [Reyranella sp.]|uniref:cache domain-containing protein n=1 Tax=Reyranella sp. TaxID=1929291 RepID=UPI003D12F3CB